MTRSREMVIAEAMASLGLAEAGSDRIRSRHHVPFPARTRSHGPVPEGDVSRKRVAHATALLMLRRDRRVRGCDASAGHHATLRRAAGSFGTGCGDVVTMATAKPASRPVRQRHTRAQERGERTRALVIDETIRCIREEGFAAASTRHIIDRAGVTWGVIQYYFGDRDGLLTAVIEHANTTLTAVPEPDRRHRRRGQ